MLIIDEVVKPNDFIIGITIPLDKRSWKRNMETNIHFDFSNKIIWSIYINDTLIPFKSFNNIVKKINLRIIRDFSFQDLRYVLNESDCKVFILFAHWYGKSIEFFDDFYDSNDILEIFPRDRIIIFDLNVCTCKYLAEKLAVNRTKSMVRHSSFNIPSIPGAWFLFYSYFFTLIDSENITYIDAMNKTSQVYENIFKDEN